MSAATWRSKATMRWLAETLPVSRHLIAYWIKFRTRKAARAVFGPGIAQLCDTEASKYHVVPDIDAQDFIFQSIVMKMGGDPRGAVVEYFATGDHSANKLRSLLLQDLDLPLEPIRLLEFASGYGCVSRHLAKHAREIALTVCDIHDEAGAFYARHLHLPFVLSADRPEDFKAPSRFDVVFALSFFSHMPETSWVRWLAALFDCVAPGGYLIFTTHGMLSRENFGNPRLSKNGFMFVPRSEQLDLEPSQYGSTITAPTFVKAAIDTLPNARLFMLREGDWWGHQDLYVVHRPKSAATSEQLAPG